MKHYMLLFFFASLLSCKESKNSTVTEVKTETLSPVKEYSELAVLWQQHAAECRALSYQAFNIAKIQLENIVKNSAKFDKPLAIVTDVDETVLDNSPFNGKLIELDEGYSSEEWDRWCKKESAELVPGALEFFQYAKELGVEVFYISNRKTSQVSVTLANLKKYELPNLNEENLLFKETTSGKKVRRLKVEETHEIVMLIGDNLSDFSEVFDKKPSSERNSQADDLKAEFGHKFIVLPNTMYGGWDTWSSDSIRQANIESYN